MTRLSAPPFFFYNNLKITNDKCLWTILHICVFDVQFLFIRRIKEVYEHNCIMTNSWQHPHCTPCFHKPFNSDVLVYYKNEETAIQYVYRYDFFCCCCFLEVFFVFWKTHILQGTHFHLLLKKKKKKDIYNTARPTTNPYIFSNEPRFPWSISREIHRVALAGSGDSSPRRLQKWN